MARAVFAVHRALRLSRSERHVAVLRRDFRAARLLPRRCLEPLGPPPQRPMAGARLSNDDGGMLCRNAIQSVVSVLILAGLFHSLVLVNIQKSYPMHTQTKIDALFKPRGD